jgi:hypothetical protein
VAGRRIHLGLYYKPVVFPVTSDSIEFGLMFSGGDTYHWRTRTMTARYVYRRKP